MHTITRKHLDFRAGLQSGRFETWTSCAALRFDDKMWIHLVEIVAGMVTSRTSTFVEILFLQPPLQGQIYFVTSSKRSENLNHRNHTDFKVILDTTIDEIGENGGKRTRKNPEGDYLKTPSTSIAAAKVNNNSDKGVKNTVNPSNYLDLPEFAKLQKKNEIENSNTELEWAFQEHRSLMEDLAEIIDVSEINDFISHEEVLEVNAMFASRLNGTGNDWRALKPAGERCLNVLGKIDNEKLKVICEMVRIEGIRGALREVWTMLRTYQNSPDDPEFFGNEDYHSSADLEILGEDCQDKTSNMFLNYFDTSRRWRLALNEIGEQ
ncbi:hypothetical protein G9A89_012569 [Geosiphon pyriformis]|nr:hypothetical protein G9A89_012569 [Geosiphon pyriformis]